MTNPENPVPVTEPSIWDHFVSRLKFWSRGNVTVDIEDQEMPEPEPDSEERKTFPWLTVVALVLALIAQLTLEPSPNRTPGPGVVLYAGALGCLVVALIRREWHLPAPKPDADGTLSMTVKTQTLLTGTVLAVFAFVLFVA